MAVGRVITTEASFSTSLRFCGVVVKVTMDSSYIWIFKGASIKGILHITYICVYSKVFHIQLVAIHNYIESIRVNLAIKYKLVICCLGELDNMSYISRSDHILGRC